MRNAGWDSRLPVVMLSRPGGKNKTEGLQYLFGTWGTFRLAQQGNFSHCSETRAIVIDADKRLL